MKKNKIFTIKTILSFAAATLFLACANMEDGSVSNAASGQGGAQAPVMVTVNGSLAFGGACPAQIAALVENSGADGLDGIARSAFPDAASSGLTYSVYALEELPSGSTDTPLRYEGTVAVDKKSYTVGIPVTSGKKYYVHVVVKQGDLEVFSGKSALLDFTASPTEFYANCDIALGATQTSGKKGCVQLAVNVEGAGVSSARAVYTDPSDGSQKTIDIALDLGGSALTFSIGINDEGEPDPANGLASGAYLMTFNFYSSSNCTGTPVYSFKEAVNVFDGMTTNKWVKNGAEPWLTPDSSGNIACKITDAMVTGFTLTDIYVDTSAVDDSGSGSFMHPKQTFAAAVGMLLNENADYTIHIKGTVFDGQTIPSTISAKSLTLCGATPLPTTGANKGIPQDIIDAQRVAGKSALLIETAVPITIKNLKITGGMGTVDSEKAYGGGICLKAEDGSLTLASGAYVSENRAKIESATNKGRGAGICLYPACSLNILDGAVIEKNESEGAGGGIFCNSTSAKKAVITMSGGHIRGNTAANNGGALNIGFGTFTMTGGVIGDDSASIRQAAKYGDPSRKSEYSNAARLGGAISSSGTGSSVDIYLLGGTIAYNCAQDNGGAIYLGGCNMTVKNAKIQYNGAGGATAVGLGGAFCFSHNADLHLEDCSIIGNECYGGGALGGAICVEGASPTGDTSNIYLKGSVSIPSDGALKNDIVLKKNSNTSATYLQYPALTIEGKLTGSGKIARLTPTSVDYDVKRVVLKLADDVTDTTLANEAYKFDVTPQVSQTWIVSSDGKLKKSTTLTSENIGDFIAPNAECHLVIGSDVSPDSFKTFLQNFFASSSGNQIGPASTLDLSQATQLDGTEWRDISTDSVAMAIYQPFETVIISPSFGEAWAGIESAHLSFAHVSNIVAPSNNENLVSKDGVLFSKDEKKILFWPGNKVGPVSGGIPEPIDYTIPNTVTEIGTFAFSHSNYLMSVTIPESVNKIGKFGLPFNSGWTGMLYFSNPNGWHKTDLSGDVVSPSDLTAAKYIAELKNFVLVRE